MEKFKDEINSFPVMSFEEYSQRKHVQPYIYEIEAGAKKLSYFGSHHSHDPNDPMFAEIENMLEPLDAQLVMVEGFEGLNENKEQIIENLSTESYEEAIERGGEFRFTMKLAASRGIDMQSPEPKSSDEIKHLESRFSREGIFVFYLYRSLNQYWRLNEAKRPSIDDYLKLELEDFKALTEWENFDYSIDNLEYIGRDIWGAEGDFDNKEVASDRIDPIPWPDKQETQTVINDIARASTRYRDEYIVTKIKEALEKHDRVFVVYGASHAYMQEPALRALLKTTN